MTLTEASFWTKLGLKIGAVVLSVIIITLSIVTSIKMQKPNLPPRYLEADNKCGMLPPLDIEGKSILAGSDPEFKIETTSGTTEDYSKVVNVYKYEHLGQSLSALSEAKTLAEQLEFDPQSVQKSPKIYLWRDSSSGKTLKVDAGTLHFALSTDFTRSDALPKERDLPGPNEATELAKNLLKQIGAYRTDYSTKDPEVTLVMADKGRLREAPSLQDADLIRVDFFRTRSIITLPQEKKENPVSTGLTEEEKENLGSGVDQNLRDEEGKYQEVQSYPKDIVNNTLFESNISVYLGGRDVYKPDLDVYKIDYIHWDISTYPCGTYKIITPGEAMTKVQNGEGFLTYLRVKGEDKMEPYTPKLVKTFTILETELAYYDSTEKQEFLQPIFIVSGEAELANGQTADFAFYAPAIRYDSITEPKEETTTNTVTTN